MSESTFQKVIRGFMKKAGIDAPVFFDFDPDRVMYFAYIPSEEIRATGRPTSRSISYRVNGRTFMSAI